VGPVRPLFWSGTQSTVNGSTGRFTSTAHFQSSLKHSCRSPKKRRLRGDLVAAFQYLKGAQRKDGENIFSRACCDRTRSNGFKLKQGTFRLDIRKKFFTMRVVKHWNRLPRDVLEAPSLETFKARLDWALSNLV